MSYDEKLLNKVLAQAWHEGYLACERRSHAVHVDLSDPYTPDYSVVFGPATRNPYLEGQ